MIVNVLAVIGAVWIVSRGARLLHWRFAVNRDGGSGRYRHWSVER